MEGDQWAKHMTQQPPFASVGHRISSPASHAILFGRQDVPYLASVSERDRLAVASSRHRQRSSSPLSGAPASNCCTRWDRSADRGRVMDERMCFDAAWGERGRGERFG